MPTLPTPAAIQAQRGKQLDDENWSMESEASTRYGHGQPPAAANHTQRIRTSEDGQAMDKQLLSRIPYVDMFAGRCRLRYDPYGLFR